MVDNTEKYGPHTAEVEAIIEQIKTFTEVEIREINKEMDRLDPSVVLEAMDNALDNAEVETLDETEAEIGDVARDVNPDWVSTFHAAWDATWVALIAISAKDDITPEHYKTLVGPWESVMGPIKSEGRKFRR
ncbi:MAG: hypothetical protein ACYCU8_07475 [Ferrimicrobium acidiphilum]